MWRCVDLTLARRVRSPFGAIDRDLCVAPSDLTVEIRHTWLNCDDTWTAVSDRTLTCVFGHIEAARPVTPRRQAVRGPMALFRGAFYLSPLAGSSSLSWPFALT
jgi:hypothetical protein